jgi:putative endonuclease
MQSVTTTQKGDEGEAIACAFLKNAGYRILDKKWRFKRLEVDIIAAKGETIVFVEVKTRKNAIFAEPELAVTPRKQAFLISAAHHYITTKDINAEARFDIVAVTGGSQDCEIKHLEGAFFPVVK